MDTYIVSSTSRNQAVTPLDYLRYRAEVRAQGLERRAAKLALNGREHDANMMYEQAELVRSGYDL